MPVDCTVDPDLKGKVYEVGPSQPFKTIQSVPWTSLKDGSTVRIHNEDTSGTSPTTYHEYFQLALQAKRTQPIRVCGVPDSHGNLAVIDGDGATGRSDVSNYSAGYTRCWNRRDGMGWYVL
jgi:predicted RNase H-like nuclease